MTDPRTAALRFLTALELGGLLGLLYGFLRPLRPRHTAPADGLFILVTLAGWVYLAFGVCRGDPRFGYLVGMMVGGFVWELTIGRALRSVFSGFWKKLGRLWAAFCLPWKKFFKKVKNMFASAEKWVTIRWNNRRHSQCASQGGHHEKTKKSVRGRAGGLPPEQAPDQGGGDRRYRVVYRGAGDSALDSE